MTRCCSFSIMQRPGSGQAIFEKVGIVEENQQFFFEKRRRPPCGN
jgi:hypothetical protein